MRYQRHKFEILKYVPKKSAFLSLNIRILDSNSWLSSLIYIINCGKEVASILIVVHAYFPFNSFHPQESLFEDIMMIRGDFSHSNIDEKAMST
jgi:hypothetical protein